MISEKEPLGEKIKMDINKTIAQYEWEIFGSTPKVHRYYNDNESKNIDILCCKNTPQTGVQSCATIGLNAVDIGMTSGNKELRVELLAVGDIKNNYICNITASAAFEIMRTKTAYPGYIIPDIISQYIPETEMKHILLTNPFLWENIETVTTDERYIAWLLIIPISQTEYKYAHHNGVDALETVFEQRDIDIYDIYRNPVI